MPKHVGSFNLCGLPAGFKDGFHKAVIELIGKRLHPASVFNRKLVFMPMDLGHPSWVAADSVGISFHIRLADAVKKGAALMTLAGAAVKKPPLRPQKNSHQGDASAKVSAISHCKNTVAT